MEQNRFIGVVRQSPKLTGWFEENRYRVGDSRRTILASRGVYPICVSHPTIVNKPSMLVDWRTHRFKST
jgi:hypothetical protein